MTKKKNPHIGSLFQDWLKAEGIREEANNGAIKAIVSWQFELAMKEGGRPRPNSRALQTSRSQVDRILDPENDTVSLATLSRAVELVARKLHLELT